MKPLEILVLSVAVAAVGVGVSKAAEELFIRVTQFKHGRQR